MIIAFTPSVRTSLLHGRCNMFGKTVLLQFVPISFFHAAAAVGAGALEAAPRTVGALLVSGWILFGKHSLNGQIWKFRIACITQE